MAFKYTIAAALGGAALTLGAIAPAEAFTATSSSITDQEFNQLILDGAFSELFVAETRTGNASTNPAEREFGVNAPLVPNANNDGLVGGLPLDAGNRDLTSGETFDFELMYNAVTGQINYNVGGQLLEATIGNVPANGIFLRTNAQGRNTQNGSTQSSEITLSNLMLDDGNGFQAVPSLTSLFTQGNSRDTDYLVIADLMGSFTLKGQQTLSWDGLLPSNSRLAAQIKVGTFNDPESVPEPATILGIATVAGLGLGLKRRRLQA